MTAGASGKSKLPPCSVLTSVDRNEKPANLAQCLQCLGAQSCQAAEIVPVEGGAISADLAEVIGRFVAVLPIRSPKLRTNVGPAGALNAGLRHCQHAMVARMDIFDVCLPERLERQLAFMQGHPRVGGLGAWVQ